MAFLIANFAPVGGQSSRGSAPQHFSYKTADAAATIDTAGYFNGASGLVDVGDIIEVISVAALGANPEVVSGYSLHAVLSNAAGVVDVSDNLNIIANQTPVDTD